MSTEHDNSGSPKSSSSPMTPRTSEESPFYVVFAGINGAGKSTLYQSGFWKIDGLPSHMARVNPDEIARSLAQVEGNKSKDIAAGRTALSLIEEHFAKRESFNQETTLSGRSALRNIERAHRLGYRVILFYVGVENEHVAIERIAHRVSLGGHHIEEDAVRRRFGISLRNFSKALPYCEEAFAIDNTRGFSILARWQNGMISWWGNPKSNGPWLLDAIGNKEIWGA